MQEKFVSLISLTPAQEIKSKILFSLEAKENKGKIRDPDERTILPWFFIRENSLLSEGIKKIF